MPRLSNEERQRVLDEVDLTALRDENDSLRQECQDLRVAVTAHETFMEEIGKLMPPSYDSDDAMEAIVLYFLKDMQSLAQIIAKLTADYR